MVQRAMVRTAVVSAVAFLLVAGAAGAATVTLEDKNLAVGLSTAFDMTLRLVNDPGDGVAGAQADIVFDPDLMILTGASAGPAAEAAGKSVAVSELEPGRARVVVAGMNLNTIGDGVLARLSFIMSWGTLDGGYAVALEELMLADEYGEAVPAVAEGGLVTVTALPLPACRWWVATLSMLAVSGLAVAAGSGNRSRYVERL